MASRFFSIKEIPGKLEDFKDTWFKIAQGTEDLSNFRSGFDRGFKNGLKSLSSNLEACGILVTDLCISCEHHLPEKKDDFVKCRKIMTDIFDRIGQELDGDIEVLEKYKSLLPKVEEMEKNLESTIKSKEEVKKHAHKTRTRYETVKEGYFKKITNIKEATDENIKKINKTFIADVEDIFKGYNIFTQDKREKVGLDVFFERMIKDPDYHQKVNIVPKGFSLSRKKSDIEARLILLRYKAEEITKKIAPIIDEEARRIAKYQEEQRLMHELEIKSGDLKDKDDKLSTRMKIIQMDLNALRSEAEYGGGRFRNYEKLQELKERYAKSFRDTAGLRKDLESLIIGSLREYEPEETDIEKRELKEEIKKLKRRVATLDDEREMLKKKSKEIEKIKVEFDGAKAEIKSQKDRISALEKEKNFIENRMQNRINDTKAEQEEVSRNLSKIIRERNLLKEEEITLQKLLRRSKEKQNSIADELQSKIDDVKSELEETSSNLSKVIEERNLLNEEKITLQKQLQRSEERKTTLHEEIERSLAREKKDKLLVEDKLRRVLDDLENTLDERDGLMKDKKRLEDGMVHLENENKKLKKQVADTIDKLNVTIERYDKSQNKIRDYKEKLRERKDVLRSLKKNYDKIIVELDEFESESEPSKSRDEHSKSESPAKKKPVTTKKQKAAGESDETVVEKKIRALREKKRG